VRATAVRVASEWTYVLKLFVVHIHVSLLGWFIISVSRRLELQKGIAELEASVG
jgi:hypothetical protein